MHARDDLLVSELKHVGWLLSPPDNFLRANIGKRLAGANRRTHRPFTYRCAVVAHIAFHHLLVFRKDLGDAEGTGKDAVRAADATWLQR